MLHMVKRRIRGSLVGISKGIIRGLGVPLLGADFQIQPRNIY